MKSFAFALTALLAAATMVVSAPAPEDITSTQKSCLAGSACKTDPKSCLQSCFADNEPAVNDLGTCYSKCTEDTCMQACNTSFAGALNVPLEELIEALQGAETTSPAETSDSTASTSAAATASTSAATTDVTSSADSTTSSSEAASTTTSSAASSTTTTTASETTSSTTTQSSVSSTATSKATSSSAHSSASSLVSSKTSSARPTSTLDDEENSATAVTTLTSGSLALVALVSYFAL
ncbi:hypothetical protein H4R33_002486 [Dimargaris cristalligena]|uniref:Extracellular membrane protein CFEM domain-containing protein n=1 Tax=Dimargaris cristalligena TaxID=215637 RepID=A0A4P9ZTX6_9FUNG|nr:hypothetical protein H4R33_002486 [Dimargaris cristalligena]RKP37046.1 hypothetical protein BJ085DRAFT_32480 [Dimargaris cristalligena]|eukprot:RKP37046.1 hypothetical protein BJ085DRAFT_32480 [Dimargaris cristalligena]